MNLLNFMPIGKKYRKTRKQLMYEAKLQDEKIFKNELTELRKEYLIMFDDGYYLPSSKEEYSEIIEKMEKQNDEIRQRLKIAYKEMEKKYE